MRFGDKIKDLEMKKIIGYVRTSTSTQQNSIKVQTQEVMDYCEKNNLVLSELVVDEGVSGKNNNTTDGYKKIMKMVDSGEVDTLIVLSLSRWGRTLKQNLLSIEQMIDKNIKFVSLKEQVDTSTPMGRFLINVMSSLYQMEREMISDRVKDTLKNKKQNGKVYSGTPYGYDVVNDVLVKNTKEQKTLNKIYSLRNKGLSYQKISNFLNRNKHQKKNGKKFSRYDVFHIVKTDRTNINVGDK